MIDPDETENILENGYFKDESVWQDDNWHKTRTTSPPEGLMQTNQQIFLNNFAAGIQGAGTPLRTPTTPGTFKKKKKHIRFKTCFYNYFCVFFCRGKLPCCKETFDTRLHPILSHDANVCQGL
jgi:hypothetical protein